MTLNKVQFKQNKASNGGVFVIENEAQIDIINVEIFNNHASNKGGVANIVLSNLVMSSISHINFKSCPSIYSNTAFNGGLFNIEHKYASLLI